MLNSLSIRHGRVTLLVDLPTPVMSAEVFDVLQKMHPHILWLAERLEGENDAPRCQEG